MADVSLSERADEVCDREKNPRGWVMARAAFAREERLQGHVEVLEQQRKELQEECERLWKLVVAHHAAGALENILVGDRCPVCLAYARE